MKNIKEIIANNLQTLRKQKKLTQFEVGEAVHYSDKAVSRWEKGESLPDVETLQLMADFFGVKISYLFEEHIVSPILPEENKQQAVNKIICISLSVLIVWLISLFIFLYLGSYSHIFCWQLFVWAVPASALVLMYFNKIWGQKKYSTVLSSVLIWSLIASLYCQFITYNIWLIFLVGAPIQVVIVLNSLIKNIKQSEKKDDNDNSIPRN